MGAKKLMCRFGMDLLGYREERESFIPVQLRESMRIEVDDRWRRREY